MELLVFPAPRGVANGPHLAGDSRQQDEHLVVEEYAQGRDAFARELRLRIYSRIVTAGVSLNKVGEDRRIERHEGDSPLLFAFWVPDATQDRSISLPFFLLLYVHVGARASQTPARPRGVPPAACAFLSPKLGLKTASTCSSVQ